MRSAYAASIARREQDGHAVSRQHRTDAPGARSHSAVGSARRLDVEVQHLGAVHLLEPARLGVEAQRIDEGIAIGRNRSRLVADVGGQVQAPVRSVADAARAFAG